MKKIRNIMFLFVIVLAGVFMASCDKTNKEDQLELDSAKELLNVRFTNSGDILNSVTGDLNLVTTIGEATITWDSSNKDVVKNNGEVIRGEADVVVELTATIKVGELQDTKKFTVTVLAMALDSYMVSFNADGGTPVPELQEVTEGSTAVEPEEPTKDRHQFAGWFIEGETTPFDFATPITEKISLKAMWDLTEPLVAFNLGYAADDQVPSQRIFYGAKAVKPKTPVRDRYTFEGWYLDGETTKFDFENTAITKDIVLTAQWRQDEIVVSFELGFEGEAPADQSLVIGDKVTKPADPTRDRYKFMGWVLEGQTELYDFNKEVLADINLVASWEQLVAIVTFDANGGTPTPEAEEINVGQVVSEPAEPVREGHEFVGWLSNNVLYDFTQEVTEDLHLIANWKDEEVVVNAVINGPSVVTYYLGSTEFDPLRDFSAIDEDTNEELDIFVSRKAYRLIPGTYEYYVAVVSDPGIERRVSLTIKPQANIPNALPSSEVEILMWHSNGSTIENKLKEYAEDFEDLMRRQGYNIKVVIEKPASTYDDLRSTVVNAIKGAELPNLVQNYPDHVVEYDNNGVIESLAPYIFHPIHGLDPNDPTEALDDIVEAYRNENKSNNLIGDYLSLPFNKSTEVAVYNKTFFDAVLKGRPFPETWQDLFALTDDIMAIKDEQIDLIASRWAAAGNAMSADDIRKSKEEFVPFTLDSMGNAFITLTRQFAGKYTSRNPVTGKGTVEFVNDQTKRMLEYFATQEGFTVPQRWGVDYANNVSLKGTTIFSVGSTAGLRYNVPVENGYKLYEIGVASVPYDNQNPSSRTAIQQGTNISLTTSGTPEQKLASWLFLKYITSSEVQADFGIVTGYSPVRHSSFETQMFKDYLASADKEIKDSYSAAGLSASAYKIDFEETIKAMGSVVAEQQKNFMFYDEAFIGSSQAREAVGNAFERVMLYEGSNIKAEIEAALLAAKEEAERVIT